MASTAEEIKRLRKKEGLTQEQLGEVIGVTGMAISKYESGDAVPSDDNKMKIARHFGVSVESLFFTNK